MDYASPDEAVLQKSSMTPEETKRLILARVSTGKTYMQPFWLKHRRSSARLLDPSAIANEASIYTNNGVAVRDVPIGEVNYLAMNIRQKVASLAYANADYVITSPDPQLGEVVRKTLRDSWRKEGWARTFQRVLQNRFTSGMGIIRYLWDLNKGFQLEYVKPEDIIFDPHCTDHTYDEPRWAAIRLWVPKEIAYERYGSEVFGSAKAGLVPSDGNTARPGYEQNSYEIWTYYDADFEIEIWEDNIVKVSKNHYDRVPIHVLLGDINPTGDFPLSDFDTSLGTFEMLRRLTNILNQVAANGGGTLWMRSDLIDEKVRDKVIAGQHEGPILVSGGEGAEAIGYTANQQLNPSLLEAIKLMSQGLDADTGVTEYDRGVITSDPKFATQAALLQRSAGARGNIARLAFELFVEKCMHNYVDLVCKFGMDERMGPLTDEAKIIYTAFKSVQDLRLVEESTTFKDPGLLQQQNMQLLQEAASLIQVMGMFGVVPNLKKIFDDVLRAFDKKNVDEYYLQIPKPQPQQQGQPTGDNPQEEQQEQSMMGGGGQVPPTQA